MMVGMTRSKALSASAILVAAVTVLTACSAVQPTTQHKPGGGNSSDQSFGTLPDPSAVKPGGTLIMGLSSEPDTLDPTVSGSSYSRFIFGSICEKLYDTDKNAKVVPQLATALPVASSDGLTYTIALRTDAVFADGTKMDAAAVASSLNRDISLATSKRKSELGPISSIDVADSKHVALHYTKPFSALSSILADRAGMIVSPTAVKAEGGNFGTNPVCVGPFKFSSWIPQTSIEVVKDPNYYAADKVYFDKIDYKIMIDSTVRSANLRSGDIQVANNLSTQDMGTLSKDKKLTVLQSASLAWRGLVINVGNANGLGKPTGHVDGPLANQPLVREALSYAIDRKALIQTAFGGWYDVAFSPIAPASEFAGDASKDAPAHDAKKSLALLKQAGVQIPVPITIESSTNVDTERYLQALQAQVADAGFAVTLQPMEETSFVSVGLAPGKFEAGLVEWSGRIDPDGNISPFLATHGSQNYGGYSTPAMDSLLSRATETSGVSARKDLYNQVVSTVQKDADIIWLFRPRNLTGVSNSVVGVQVFPDGITRVAFAGFRK